MRSGWLLLVLIASLAPMARAEIVVTDATGHEVRLEQPARRIVSLAPHVTELLFEAGAGERVVAAVNYSDHPPAARELPRVGSYNRFDLERILALQPDLVVGWQSGNPGGQLERLRELGLTVYVTEPRNLSAVADSLEIIGRLAGTSATASRTAEDYRARLQRLRGRYADRRPIDVFYEIWNDPLMTVNGDHLISDVIRGCGGRNVFADLPAIAPRISVEAVLARDPAVIVASGMDAERPEWLDEWRRWPELRAVAGGDLYFIPPDFLQRHTPRVLDGMQRLCEQLERARS